MKYFMIDQIKGGKKIKDIEGASSFLFMGTSLLFSVSMALSFCFFYVK